MPLETSNFQNQKNIETLIMTKVIIGDVHTKFEKVEKIISQYDEDCSIILTGDYFDDFDDTPELNADTAKWLKESLTKPNRIHLFGNHDFQYRIKPIGSVTYSGFHYKKYEKINEILTEEDWDKLEYFHSIENYWFSHAGITRYWFEHPVLGLTVEGINAIITEAKKAVKASNLVGAQPLIAADYYRGGRHKKGGLLWNHHTNTDYIDGITQIYGHTEHNEIQVKRALSNVTINIDTGLREILELDTDFNIWKIKKV